MTLFVMAYKIVFGEEGSMENNTAYLPVICISERKSMPGQITVGEYYMLDRLSVFIDGDGDAFGVFYDASNNRVGNLLLSHFRTA